MSKREAIIALYTGKPELKDMRIRITNKEITVEIKRYNCWGWWDWKNLRKGQLRHIIERLLGLLPEEERREIVG